MEENQLHQQFQSGLGRHLEEIYKAGKNIFSLNFGRVTKVNYQYNTVEVMTITTGDETRSSQKSNGKFSAKLPVEYAGMSNGKSFGHARMVTVGSLVLIGYVGGDKDNPVVVNVYSDADIANDIARTTLTSADDRNPSIQQYVWNDYKLYPSLTYSNIDGRGNVEKTYPGKTFFSINSSDPEEFMHTDLNYDYEDLAHSFYNNDRPIEPIEQEAPSMLFVHRGLYDPHRLKFFINTQGMMRLSSSFKGEGAVSFFEMSRAGDMFFYRQRDTEEFHESHVKDSFGMNRWGEFRVKVGQNELIITEFGARFNNKPILTGEGITDSEALLEEALRAAQAVAEAQAELARQQAIADARGLVGEARDEFLKDAEENLRKAQEYADRVAKEVGDEVFDNAIEEAQKRADEAERAAKEAANTVAELKAEQARLEAIEAAQGFLTTEQQLRKAEIEAALAQALAAAEEAQRQAELEALRLAQLEASKAREDAEAAAEVLATARANAARLAAIAEAEEKATGQVSEATRQLRREADEQLAQAIAEAGRLAEEAERKANAYTEQQNKNFVSIIEYVSKIEEIENQLDGNITTWFFDYDPTMDNYPAMTWVTTEEKQQHLGDLFYNTDSGGVFRFMFDDDFGWKPLSDTLLQKALEMASKAQDTADGKRRIFVVEPRPPYDVGDMWTQGSGGDLLYCVTSKQTGVFSSDDWAKASRYTDDSRAEEINLENIKRAQDLQENLEGQLEVTNRAISTFETAVRNAFRDGEISSIDAYTLRYYIQSVQNEHRALQQQVSIIVSDPALPGGQTMTNLTRSWNNFNDTYSALITLINRIIQKTTVTEDEIEEVNEHFDAYRLDLENLVIALQNAIDAIAGKRLEDQRDYLIEYIAGLQSELEQLLRKELTDGLTDEEIKRVKELQEEIERLTKYVDEKAEEVADNVLDLAQKAADQAEANAKSAAQIAAEAAQALAELNAEAKAKEFISEEEARRIAQAEENLETALNAAELAQQRAAEAAQAYADERLKDFVSNIDMDEMLRELEGQIDGKMVTWFYAHAPTLNNEPAINWNTRADQEKHIGDLFFNTVTNKVYRFKYENGMFSWDNIDNKDIEKALEYASKAQDTADGKRQVFVTLPVPPYDIGDLWLNEGKLYRCTIAKEENQNYAPADFVHATGYVDESMQDELDKALRQYADTKAAYEAAQAELAASEMVTAEQIARVQEAQKNLEAAQEYAYAVMRAMGLGGTNRFPGGGGSHLNLAAIHEADRNRVEIGTYKGQPSFRIRLTSNSRNLRLTTMQVEGGQNYAWSYQIASERGSVLHVANNDGNSYNSESFTAYTDWARKEKLFTANPSATYERLTFSAMGNNEVIFYLTAIQFEKGDKATDWAPSPDDYEKEFENVREVTKEIIETVDGWTARIESTERISEELTNTVADVTTELGVVSGKIDAAVTVERVTEIVRDRTEELVEELPKVRTLAEEAQSQVGTLFTGTLVTPVEKRALKNVWDKIKNEFSQLSLLATNWEIDTADYRRAFLALDSSTPRIEAEILANMGETYNFGDMSMRTAFEDKVDGYNIRATEIANDINEAIAAHASRVRGDLDENIQEVETIKTESSARFEIIEESISSEARRVTTVENNLVNTSNSAQAAEKRAGEAFTNAGQAITDARNARDTATGAKTAADNARSAADAAQRSVDGIQVGGRNLLKNSGFRNGSVDGWASHTNSSPSNSAHSIIDDPTAPYGKAIKAIGRAGRVQRINSSYGRFEAGDYTVSVVAYGVGTVRIGMEQVGEGLGSFPVTQTPKQYSHTFKHDGSTENYAMSFYAWSDNANLTIHSLKVERGNKATDWTPAPEDVTKYTDDSISGIAVGGRNLIPYEKFLNNWQRSVGSSTDTYTLNQPDRYDGLTGIRLVSSSGSTTSFRLNRVIEEHYVTYSLSFWYKTSTSTATSFSIDVCDQHTTNIPASTTWKLFKLEGFQTTRDNTNIYHFIDFNLGSSQLYNVDISHIKLERGNKATDWTPAPEDVAKYTDDSISGIEIGGRNLILNSTFINGYTHWRDTSVFLRDTAIVSPETDRPYSAILQVRSANNTTPMLNSARIPGKQGEVYTITFTARVVGSFAADNVSLLTVRGYDNASEANNGVYTGIQTVSGLSESGNVTYQLLREANVTVGEWFTWTAVIRIASASRFFTIAPYLGNNTNYDIREIKVEKGNKATDWTPASEDLTEYTDGAVDNISIGGRNLVLNTGNPQSHTGTGGTNQSRNIYPLDSNRINGKTLTLSFDWALSGTVGSNASVRMQGGGNRWGFGVPALNITSNNSSGTYKETFTAGNDTTNTFSQLNMRLDNITGTITISNLKLEYGNKATDWTPAPEDVAKYTDDEIGKVNDSIENIDVGGRNLLLNSGSPRSTGLYIAAQYDFTEPMVAGQEYVVSTMVKLTNKTQRIGFYNSGGNDMLNSGWITIPSSSQGQFALITAKFVGKVVGSNTFLRIYGGVNGENGTTETLWTKLERGNKRTDWSPAPEDVDGKIDGIEVGSRNLLIKSSGNKEQPILLGDDRYRAVRVTSDYVDNYIRFTPTQDNTDRYVQFGSTDTGDTQGFLNDQDYTFSMYGQVSGNVSLRAFSNVNGSWLSERYPIANQGWGKVTQTFRFHSNAQGKMVRIMFNTTSPGSFELRAREFKIERGNRATDWSPAPEDVTEKIDGIEIGGRNLLRNSKVINNLSNNGTNYPIRQSNQTTFYRYTPADGSSNPIINMYNTIRASEITDWSWNGRNIVFSVMARTSKPNTYVRGRATRVRTAWSDTAQTQQPLTPFEWTKLEVLVPGSIINSDNNADDVLRLLVDQFDIGTANYSNMQGFYLDLCDWKIEFGTKASAWTPAPEDMQQEMETNTGINQWWVTRYNNQTITGANNAARLEAMPAPRDLELETPSEAYAIKDTNVFVETNADNYLMMFATNVYVGKPTTFNRTFTVDDVAMIYVNGQLMGTVINQDGNKTIPFILAQGWNSIHIVYYENTGSDILRLNTPILESVDRMSFMQSGVSNEIRNDLILLDETVNEALHRVTPDNIIGVVQESRTFQELMDAKANYTDLDNMATIDDVNGLRDDTDALIDNKIGLIDFTPFVERSEVEQITNAWEARFSQSGGINLIRNSIGQAQFSFWTVTNPNNILVASHNEVNEAGLASGFQFTSGGASYLDQEVQVVAGRMYTLSILVKKTTTGSARIGSVVNTGTVGQNIASLVADETRQYDYELLSDTFVAPGNTVGVRIFADSGVTGVVTGAILHQGDVPQAWTTHPEELYNTNTRIDINGLKVSQFTDGKEVAYTQMTPSEFAGYYDLTGNGDFEKVFYLQEDKTVSKRFQAQDEIMMGGLKIARVSSYTGQGWAFVSNQEDFTPGRNLIFNSDFVRGTEGWRSFGSGASVNNSFRYNGYPTLQYIHNSSTGWSFATSNTIELQNTGLIGKELTFSFWVYIPSGVTLSTSVYAQASIGSNSDMANPRYPGTLHITNGYVRNTWVRESFTFTVPDTAANSTPASHMRLHFTNNPAEQPVNSSVVIARFALPQLEIGNSPSAWRNALED